MSTRSLALPQRILVVDDLADNRAIVLHYLRRAGVDADEAASGAEALRLIVEAAARQAPYEVVIADLRMPGMSGAELAEQVTLLPNPPRMVCMTAEYAEHTAGVCASSGFQAVLRKPFRMGSLLLATCARTNLRAASA